MRFHKPLKVPLLTRVLEVGPHRTLHVAALLAFPLDAPRALVDEVSFWASVTPLLGPAGVLDEGVSRARAEFLVAGSFHAPNGVPAQASHVRVRVGELQKRLSVLGNRHWVNGVPTAPEPVRAVPIDWAHAFGGPAYGKNPHGMGIELVERGGARVQPLPNVEPWGALLRAPSERPEPAGLGPMDVMFEQRRARAGTYGAEYVAEKRVGLASDHDPLLFNVAAPDQWAPGFWTGTETFELENLHPERSLVEGRLPGLEPRVFLTRRGPAGDEAWGELPMRCDVVWLFPGALLGVVLFHGSTPVAESDASDVTELLVGCDVIGAPRPVDHFERAWRRRRDPDRARVALLSDSDLMPPRDSGVAANPPFPDIGQWTKSEGLLARNLHRGMLRNREAALQRARAEGADVEALGLGDPPPAPVFPDPEDLDAMAEEMEKLAEREAAERARAEASVASAQDRARAALAAQGIDLDEAVRDAHASADAGGPPKLDAAKIIAEQERMAAEVGDAALSARVRDPGFRSFLEEQQARAVSAYRASAHEQPPARPMTAEAAELARVVVQTALDVSEPLDERDFTGADFRGMNLRGGVFTRSLLEGADLREADLTDANLEGAVLARADLRGAILERARLKGANLGGANLGGARLGSADLREANLAKTAVARASFERCDLEGADVMEVDWDGVDLSGARLLRVTFLKGRLARCRFGGAALEQVMFLECTLDESDFTGADLHRSSFIKSRGARVRFARAKLTEAVMIGDGEFPEADLRGAELHRSCLRKTGFRGARFDGARGTLTDLSECDAAEARFDQAELRGAMFHRTNLEGASLRGCNLLEALLMDARLPRADFTGAQLTRAVLTGARGDDATRFAEADVRHARFDRDGAGGRA